MNAIRSLAVAGSGPVAWIAAAALLRAFQNARLEVTLVDTGTDGARAGRWTLPSQRGMHALLGIPEPQFVQRTGATFRLGSEHLGWHGEGSRFLHIHGDIGAELGGTPFYKFLLSEALAGRAERPEAFSLAGTAARLGRFARPMGEGGKLTAGFTYGFHLDEAAYTQYLRGHALRLGVREASAPLADVLLVEDGSIEGLSLADGAMLKADCFIDCSGAAARLIGRISPAQRVDWSAWLPCDRMWSALAPASPEPPALTQTTAAQAGWLWRAPLAQATMVGHVYCSGWQDDAAARALLTAFEPAQRGEPLLTRFSSGRRVRFWERNCVAIGEAAVELEPLAGADLHFAQLGLATLIELFPRGRPGAIEADEYNRLMAEHADALRDFTLAHYRAGAARGGDFWAALRAVPLPSRLADRLDLYAASGRINLFDHETFEETDWAWLLLGSGLTPGSLELQVRMQLAKLAAPEVAALRMHVQQVAASMPRHIDFLRHQAAIAARGAG